MSDGLLTKEEQSAQRQSEVLRLHFMEGLSARRIALKMGLSRNTVRKLLGRGTPRTRHSADSSEARASMLDPYLTVVRQMVSDVPGIRAPSVLERLRPLGYTGGITILRDRIRRLRPRDSAEAFLTLNFHPGAAMQVDWADFGYAIPGCPRRVSALVMVLCHSRYLYIEFTLSQTFGALVRGMERGLRFFGGVTMMDIFDNMKTVVQKAGPPTIFNERFLSYARSRGFAVVACNPGKGNEKGRVERPIGFVRERFWPGRRFTSLMDLNTQAATWRDDFANNREHEITNRIPSLVYAHEELSKLQPLRETHFEIDDIESAGVTRRFRVRYDRNEYSVPPRLIGQPVVIRADDEMVSVFLGPRRVAIHRRSYGVGEDIEHESHRREALVLKPRAATSLISPEIARLGKTANDYFKILAASRRSIQRETQKLIFLVELFGETASASAMDEVMRAGHVGAEYVEYVLRYKRGLTPCATPLRLGIPELDNISFSEPDMSLYDAIYPASKTLNPFAEDADASERES
jgi:transposase